MLNWGLHSRLVSLLLVPLILISVSLGIFFIHHQVEELDVSLNTRGHSLARHLANASGYAVQNNNLDMLKPITHNLLGEADVARITITNQNGEVIVQSKSNTQVTHHSASPHSTFTESLIFMEPIIGTQVKPLNKPVTKPAQEQKRIMDLVKKQNNLVNRNVVGWAIIELSKFDTRTQQYKAVIQTTMITLAAVFFAFLFVLRVSKKVSAPILHLANTAREIEKGNFNVQTDTRTKGELRLLERSIHSMAESLRRSHQKMEDEVDQATSSLLTSIQVVERQNKELQKARQEALMASKVKSEFLANMSHEIRTPMNGIMGFVKLLKETKTNEEQRYYVSTIEKSADNLLNIINAILDISKIEAGKMTLQTVDYDLQTCIDEVTSLLAPTVFEKELNLVSMIYQDVPLLLRGDEPKLKQIITNLISNAVKFTDHGDVVLRTMLEDENEETVKVKIMVSDTGIGINQDDQKRLFNTFEQADNSASRRFGGTGLGLTISKTLSEMMNGEIGVESKLNEGSTFWFTFKHQKNPNPQSLPTEPISLAGYRVLYFESNQATQLATRHQLESWDINLVSVSTLSDFLNHIEIAESKHPYDLLIMGLSYQEMQLDILSGHIEAIRKHTQSNIFCLVNSADVSLVNNIKELGISACMSKPAHYRELYQNLCLLLTPDTSLLKLKLDKNNQEDNHSNFSDKLENLRILVAEDQKINAKLMEVILLQNGAEPTIVENGLLALNAHQEQDFDAILMDIHMPEMNGVEATDAIRKLSNEKSEIPIIGLTANAMPDDREAYLMAGMDEVLIKPVDDDQLFKTIIELCRKKAKNHAANNNTSNEPTATANKAQGNTNSSIDTQPTKSKLSMSKEELTAQMCGMLIDELPQTREQIEKAHRQNNFDDLLHHVHKLHGATSYCNVPELKAALAELENQLKRKQYDDLEQMVQAVRHQIDALLNVDSIPLPP